MQPPPTHCALGFACIKKHLRHSFIYSVFLFISSNFTRRRDASRAMFSGKKVGGPTTSTTAKTWARRGCFPVEASRLREVAKVVRLACSGARVSQMESRLRTNVLTDEPPPCKLAISGMKRTTCQTTALEIHVTPVRQNLLRGYVTRCDPTPTRRIFALAPTSPRQERFVQ